MKEQFLDEKLKLSYSIFRTILLYCKKYSKFEFGGMEFYINHYSMIKIIHS